MSAIVKEVYDAFLEAGVSEQKSADAAKAIADFDSRFNTIDADLTLLQADVKILKWGIGLIIAVEILPLLKNLFV